MVSTHTRTFSTLTLAIAAAAAAPACRGNDGNNGTRNPNGNNNQPVFQCPNNDLSVCAMKLESSPAHPAKGDVVTLDNVLVTTPTLTVSKSMGAVSLAGFYVQDRSTSELLNGRFSGILVVYRPGELAGPPPMLGDVVKIDGAYDEFGSEGKPAQKQVKAAAVTILGERASVEPVAIATVDDIATGGKDAAAYEGVVVQVEEVSVSNTDLMVNNMPLFGAFKVNNSLIVSGAVYEYRNPVADEQFSAIKGVLRLGTAPYEAGENLLTPRFESDVEPKTAAVTVRSINDIQDPTAPGRPREMCRNVTGSETQGKCARADLKRVLVVAAGGYVSANLDAMWVVDPNDADKRYMGVKVVYNGDRVPYKPKAGEWVDVEGEIIDYRGGIQIQYPTISRNGTDTSTTVPVIVDRVSDLSRKNPLAHTFEGMLVRIENVAVETRCLEDDRGRDHGDFTVTGDVLIGTAFQYSYVGRIRPASVQCLTPEGEPTGLCGCMPPSGMSSRPMDRRTVGDRFRSITGVVDFSFGDYGIEPRGDFDLVKE